MPQAAIREVPRRAHVAGLMEPSNRLLARDAEWGSISCLLTKRQLNSSETIKPPHGGFIGQLSMPHSD